MTLHLQFLVAGAILLATAGPAVASAPTASADEARLEFFEKKVRPILADNCYTCHSANTNARGGLRVDDRNGLLLGGDRGPAVVPGQPEKSLLLQAVRHMAGSLTMPPKKKLSEEQIAALTQWIKDGAVWPQAKLPASFGKPNPEYDRLRKEHWAWQPLRLAPVPVVRDAAWPRTNVDRFLLAKQEAAGVRPVGDADRLTLLRRVTFDLTGLPPTLGAIDRVLHDKSVTWLETVVDELLKSPQFGERWGRHWLDVARYGESTGSARNVAYPHAWRYRDWVIDAFNRDKPYDQFIREQIAGDLLPAQTQQERDEHLIATGFLALGVKDVNQRFKVRFIMDNIDEQIDTVSRAVLALTASCARCHDHKFDPISQQDYYALAGIFHSTDLCAGLRNKMGGGGLDFYDTTLLLRLGPPAGPNPQVAQQVEKMEAALAATRAELLALTNDPDKSRAGPEREQKLQAGRNQLRKLQNDLLALTDPAANGPVALGVRDARNIGDTEIRIRGEAEKLGPLVPRGFLSVLYVPGAAPVNPKQSGRLELAQWLTHEKNPLTPRVLVNRVWHYLFGQGLVRTVDNFGVTGDTPSHPELLDYLAAQFVRDGWSIKKLVRTLVLSRAYQLSAEAAASQLAIDQGNRLFWRHAPRRLEAEEIRDAMLAAAGNLNLTRPNGSPAMALKVMELRNDGPEAKRLEEEAMRSSYRSIYLPLLRGLTPRSLEVFDFAEQGMVTGSRDATTVAPQALYLLNDPFVRRQARVLAERLLQANGPGNAERIQLAYRLTLNRTATVREVERVESYLDEYEAAYRKEASVPPTDARAVAWTSFCQALLGSAEFRLVR